MAVIGAAQSHGSEQSHTSTAGAVVVSSSRPELGGSDPERSGQLVGERVQISGLEVELVVRGGSHGPRAGDVGGALAAGGRAAQVPGVGVDEHRVLGRDAELLERHVVHRGRGFVGAHGRGGEDGVPGEPAVRRQVGELPQVGVGDRGDGVARACRLVRNAAAVPRTPPCQRQAATESGSDTDARTLDSCLPT